MGLCLCSHITARTWNLSLKEQLNCALTEDDYTRKIKEDLMIKKEILQKSYIELSEF